MPLRFLKSLNRFKLFSSFDPAEQAADPGDPVEVSSAVLSVKTEEEVESINESVQKLDAEFRASPLPGEEVGEPIGDEINPDSLKAGDKVVARGWKVNMSDYRKEFTVEPPSETRVDGTIFLKDKRGDVYRWLGGVVYGYKARRCGINVWFERQK